MIGQLRLYVFIADLAWIAVLVLAPAALTSSDERNSFEGIPKANAGAYFAGS